MRKQFLQALSLLGLFDSIYLLWEYTGTNRPMVCMGGGCDAVRASSYAHLWGLPMPVYGVVMYAFLALLVFLYPLLSGPVARLSEHAVLFISGAGFLVSLYLSGIEGFVIHSWCMWCVISAFTVTAIFILALLDLAWPGAPLEPARALLHVQRNFAVILFGVVIGVPAFILLTRNSSLPPVKSPTSKTVEAHLVRADTYFYGNPHARVTVVEFGDFECPACRAAEMSAQKIRTHFGDRIRFAFRQFPLTSIHPYAEKAAQASECAGQQGKFWQAVNMLYEHQNDLKVSALERYARGMGLDTGKFDACLKDSKMASRVAQDKKDGEALGVHATPTFFVDGHMIVGPIAYPQFKQLIDNELKKNSMEMTASTVKPATSKPAKQVLAAKTVKPKPVKNQKTVKTQASLDHSSNSMQVFGNSTSLLASLQQSSAAACSDAEAKERQPRMIGTPQAKALYGESPQVLFIDVRPAKQFRAGHIPGAVNMPIGSFEREWHHLPKNKTIVLYQGGHSTGDVCAASRSAGRILLTQGFGYSEVKVYKDGMAGWAKAGLPVKR